MVALRRKEPQVNYDLFCEVARERFQHQMSRIDAADEKVGVFLGVATVLLGLCTALGMRAHVTQQPIYAFILWGMGVATYITLSVFSVLSYRTRKWLAGPDLKTLEERCNSYNENENKQWLGEEYNESLYYNEIQLEKKVRRGDLTTRSLPVEATCLALALFLPLII